MTPEKPTPGKLAVDPPQASEDDTVELVPSSQLITLARLGLAMRAAHAAYLGSIDDRAEGKRFDAYCHAAAKCRRQWAAFSELVALARMGQSMRCELTLTRGYPATATYQAAVIAQRRWTAAAENVLAQQQQSLPGMGGEEGGGSA